MNLDRVTITGPDDSIRPEDLIPITKEFPFVEWGILFSESRIGGPRFPSVEWMFALQEVAKANRLPLSLHLCGHYVRQILMGETPQAVWTFIDAYARVQLNFRAERNRCKPTECARALLAFSKQRKQFIFQIDGERGNDHLDAVILEDKATIPGDIDIVGLFDVSGGAGILPRKWPTPINSVDGVLDYHGYAGGLGPDNLAEQIPLIAEAAGDCRIWIDMETKVRSRDDGQFDLVKVRQCLEIAKPFVKEANR